MFGWVAKVFRKKFVPCPCGGRIRVVLSWTDTHYICDACGREISEAEFERLSRRADKS